VNPGGLVLVTPTVNRNGASRCPVAQLKKGAAVAESSLYERLGGVYAISAVVDYFSDQLVERDTLAGANPNIKAWNSVEAATRLSGLKFLRTLWLCAVAGGPFEYTGKSLDDAHFRFHLTGEDFDEVAAALADALQHFHVPAAESDEVLGAFAAHKPEVTAGSTAT
jgi:hemoglobin